MGRVSSLAQVKLVGNWLTRFFPQARLHSENLSEMSGENDGGSPAGDQNQGGDAPAAVPEHLNIKVTDNNNDVFFKIRRTTKLEKLMNAFCERQGKQLSQVRFLFDGQRVQPTDTPDTVGPPKELSSL